MSDAMEEIDMQEAASSVKPQSNGETDQDIFSGSCDFVVEAYIFCVLTNSSISNLSKKKTSLSFGGCFSQTARV